MHTCIYRMRKLRRNYRRTEVIDTSRCVIFNFAVSVKLHAKDLGVVFVQVNCFFLSLPLYFLLFFIPLKRAVLTVADAMVVGCLKGRGGEGGYWGDIRYISKRRTFFDGDAYVSSETPLGDNSVLVQSPKRVYFRFVARPFRVVLRSSTSVKLFR